VDIRKPLVLQNKGCNCVENKPNKIWSNSSTLMLKTVVVKTNEEALASSQTRRERRNKDDTKKQYLTRKTSKIVKHEKVLKLR